MLFLSDFLHQPQYSLTLTHHYSLLWRWMCWILESEVPSQRTPTDHMLHPCAFFSRRLSLAESNYDVGNRELLAVVLALQEWRHWLEGASHPFIVWTDHKNLCYLRSAKRLNSRQADWAAQLPPSSPAWGVGGCFFLVLPSAFSFPSSPPLYSHESLVLSSLQCQKSVIVQ